ncbi:TetR/AcrR family transcriptional regulator [Bacillus rubiinfantis]|uniref:TetR/AcrR family transcriptional regulator n=1 Tax=Bacillus rubiinfantis TaxID=1499680 RepID=UPI0005A9E9CE|nr:TetR/AcrR family transcriptional regulator [Bacillus rubiinfantis]
MVLTHSNDALIKRVALAMAENPRYTFKELAEVSGVSKATLHRLCGTRENLESILLNKAEITIESIINAAEMDHENYIDGLRNLIFTFYDEQEIFRWLFSRPCSGAEKYYNPYFTALESFFLRGQKQGVFRIELSVEFLATIFTSSIVALIDAERTGRVAKMGTKEAFVDFFLSGIKQNLINPL